MKTIAILGKPNVGKSSLLNALVAFDRAIISPLAGTTRDTIEESLYIHGTLVRLIDTAGIRHSEDSIEQRGIERSIAGIFPPKVISILPIAAVIILLLHIAFSPIAAIAEILALGLSRTSMLMLIGVLMFFVSWYLACRKAGWRKLISISAPLSLIQICTMYIHGLYNRLTGKGFIWKGRKID